jgi:hypothetical protein
MFKDLFEDKIISDNKHKSIIQKYRISLISDNVMNVLFGFYFIIGKYLNHFIKI